MTRRDGMARIEHEIDVPLDHARSGGAHLRVLVREAAPQGARRGDLKVLVSLLGGPGGAAPRPRARRIAQGRPPGALAAAGDDA